jgi:hypothetical protein
MIRAGMLALTVAAAGCGHETPINDEVRTRDKFVRELAEREGAMGAWSLMSRAELQFEDGFAGTELVDPDRGFTPWTEVVPRYESRPAIAVRWMGARGHLRVRADGDADRRLEIHGRVDIQGLFTHPIITASFDGLELHSAPVDDNGYFLITATIPRARLSGWSDIYVTVSSIHEPWRDPTGRLGTQLTVARLERVTWEPTTSLSTWREPQEP